MGCLKMKNEDYKGKIVKMSKDNKKTHKKNEFIESSPKAVDTGTIANSNNIKLKAIGNSIMTVLSVIASLGVIAIIVGYFMNLKNSIDVLGTKFDEQSQKVNTMFDYIYTDENSINTQFTDVNNKINDLQNQLDIINQALNIKVINVTDESAISAIEDVTIQSDSGSYTLPTLYSSMPVGADAYGNIYVVKDLINEIVLLTYEEDGKEIFFLGQYNENCNWDGYCVTNSYNSDGTLFAICESNFDDGKRLDYKSFYLSGENDWILSDRICDNNINVGTSTNYYLEYKNIKNFTNTNVRRTDILYVDNFLRTVDATVTKFYCGQTYNRRYNDDSGDAYLVKYNSDGTVKTLYVGNFVNGYCDDNTGKAWNIAYSEELENYYYNIGEFKNNNSVKKSTEPITIKEIEKIISTYDFACELKWKIEDI